jgi:choline dehydrogenase-like flavoprotein
MLIQVDNDERSWPTTLIGPCHHIGTTRMDENPKLGVVNKNCRVHGTSNLYIAGSSVFPTSGSVAPTLTIVALALRLADHIKHTMKCTI